MKRHAGADHFVIRQPDRTLALLPAGMTKASRDSEALVAHPRFPVERLSDLRALIDALLASCTGISPDRRRAGNVESATQPEGRNTVATLLQALLAEAAGVGRQQTESTDREEGGDDQDRT
jgi:hypothetical protein